MNVTHSFIKNINTGIKHSIQYSNDEAAFKITPPPPSPLNFSVQGLHLTVKVF